jgi:transketolase
MNYPEIAKEVRLKVLELIYNAQSSHIGSNFSAIDFLTVLFEKMSVRQDELIVSKGWIAASIYVFLARKGIIPVADLQRYCQDGEEEYIGLIEPHGKFGLRFAGGSMGYGLPAGVGFALAKKMSGDPGQVYVVMSDGEQAIGTTWEAGLIAAHHKLDNLTVIVDYNGFQAMGEVIDILNLGDLNKKWQAMGWETYDIDGHRFGEVEFALTGPHGGRPKVIIANTVKGKGVPFMENDNLWHYKNIEPDIYEKAKACLI